MNVVNHILFLVGGIGAFNGILLGLFYLFSSYRRHLVKGLFGLLLILLSLRVVNSVILFFDRSMEVITLPIGMIATFLSGPVLFGFIRLALKEEGKMPLLVISHFVLSLIVISIIWIVSPYHEAPVWWDHTFRYYVAGWLAIYIVLSGYQFKNFNSRDISEYQKWIILIYVAVVAMCLCYVLSLYTTYILGPLSYSLIFYGVLLIWFFQFRRVNIFFQNSRDLKSSILSKDRAKVLSAKLENLMKEDKLFLSQDLNQQLLAKQLKISTHHMSALLNDYIGLSYADFLKAYRMREAIALLHSNNELSLEGISSSLGYKSKSTFYNHFKDTYGVTPAQYRSR